MKPSSTERNDTPRTSQPGPTALSSPSTLPPGLTGSSGSQPGTSPATSSGDGCPKSPGSSLPSRPRNGLALSESAEHSRRLDALIVGCFTAQRIFGRDPGSLEAVNHIFHATLARYPASHCLRAFELWLERSQEFPTPADIIGIIRRKGRPPLSREVYIAISKKDPELRDASDWQFIREYEAEQREDASGFDDEGKAEATTRENVRLRQQVLSLIAENKRLADLLHHIRIAKGLEPPKPSRADKVRATVAAMRAGGAPEEDIAAFEASEGMAVSA